jgi:hypothetical protein
MYLHGMSSGDFAPDPLHRARCVQGTARILRPRDHLGRDPRCSRPARGPPEHP